jgi:uncharacterized protein
MKLAVTTASSAIAISDLPIILECVDKKENIDEIKPMLDTIIKKGLITEEKVKIILYEGNKK